jgi:galactose-1-phosphate uridylyltransferase
VTGERRREVSPDWLHRATEIPDAGEADYDAIVRSVREDPGIPAHEPRRRAAVDPRTGERVVFCARRAVRPHDQALPEEPPEPESCLVCEGRTTSVIDRATLTGGDETFINKNLFPIAFPAREPLAPERADVGPAGEDAAGLHFLQWTSTRHDRDLPDMPVEDVAILLERLAVLERTCLHGSGEHLPRTRDVPGDVHHGYFVVIKNVGRLVGGSLVHGHQQMLHTSIRPRRVGDDARFLRRRGEPFARSLLRETPPELVVRSYDGGARLVVPWFMRRPLEMILALEGEGTWEHLHDLEAGERRSLAAGLVDATRAVRDLMPRLGREIAYNLAFHTGPVGSLYVEMLPYTQERGGFEHTGIVVCQAEPETMAAAIREILG